MDLFNETRRWLNNTVQIIKKNIPNTFKQALEDAKIIIAPIALPLKVVSVAIAYLINKNLSKKKAIAVAISLTAANSCTESKFNNCLNVIEATPETLILALGNFSVSQANLEQICTIFGDCFNYARYYLDNCVERAEFYDVKDITDMILKSYKEVLDLCQNGVWQSRLKSGCGLREKSACVDKNVKMLLSDELYSSNMKQLKQGKRNVSIEDVKGICGKVEKFFKCARKVNDAISCPSVDKEFNKELQHNGTGIIVKFCNKRDKRKSATAAVETQSLMIVLYYFEFIVLRAI